MVEPHFNLEPPLGDYPFRFTHEDRHQYRVKVQPAGACLEFVVRAVDTQKCADADYRAWAGIARGKRVEPPSDADREDSLRRSAERARRQVRLLALELGADRLLTFTTRDVLPLQTLQVVWDRFIRLVRLVHPGFHYLAVPEPHKDREHWHVHAACSGWINVRMLRKMWHAALASALGRNRGGDTSGRQSPGNVDIQYRGRASGVHKTRRIAGYIAKYITKDLVERFNKKRYWHSKEVKVQESRRRWLESGNLEDAIKETMRAYGLLMDGEFPVCRVWKPGNLAYFWIETHQLDPPPF